MNYAPQFITLLEKLESLMTKKANISEEEPIPRLKTLLYCMENQFINDEIKGLPNVGSTILKNSKNIWKLELFRF